jgi:hypothetical protein
VVLNKREAARACPDLADVPWELRFHLAMPPTGCWLWTGSTAHGYGRVTWQGKQQQVHRLVYESATNCQRGRRAKLNQTAADEIRAAVARGEKRTDLAQRYGVSRAAIGHVITGRTWPLTHRPHMEPPAKEKVPFPPRGIDASADAGG